MFWLNFGLKPVFGFKSRFVDKCCDDGGLYHMWICCAVSHPRWWQPLLIRRTILKSSTVISRECFHYCHWFAIYFLGPWFSPNRRRYINASLSAERCFLRAALSYSARRYESAVCCSRMSCDAFLSEALYDVEIVFTILLYSVSEKPRLG